MTVALKRDPVGWSWALLGLGAASVAALWVIDPFNSRWLPPCAFRALTGLYCPGCGSTRALYCLVHGEVGAALRFNPLLIVALPFLTYAVVAPLAERHLGLRRLRFELKASASWGILVMILAYSVLRNLPIEPFTLMSP